MFEFLQIFDIWKDSSCISSFSFSFSFSYITGRPGVDSILKKKITIYYFELSEENESLIQCLSVDNQLCKVLSNI